MRSTTIRLIGLTALSLFMFGCPKTETIPPDERRLRQERIREYYEERHKRLDVVATTVTSSGQTIDWIRPESQTLSGIIATAPAETTRWGKPTYSSGEESPEEESQIAETPTQGEEPEQSASFEVQTQVSARGPQGTVPVVRFDVEEYLASVGVPPEDPRDVLKKMIPPAPAANDRYYAVWKRRDRFYGSAGRINIWNTAGPVNNETSIAQVAVIRGDPMQAIEAGKIENQALNGDLRPHFFVYYRTNGRASGDWVGGYNALVDGWIQVSRSVAPGMSLIPWESRENGNQYSLYVEVRLHEGNWWVKAHNEWAGYYPGCRGGDAAPCDSGTLFSAAGIRDQASRLDWYGEVFDSSAPAATSTDMGSGDFAADGWQHAAYFRNLTFFWAPTTYWWWDSGRVTVTDAACYTRRGPFYSNQAAWRNWYFYGGPGREAAGCN